MWREGWPVKRNFRRSIKKVYIFHVKSRVIICSTGRLFYSNLGNISQLYEVAYIVRTSLIEIRFSCTNSFHLIFLS